ncbi:MAG TPA: lytic transglycosylase domain-containing protein [Paenibacillaceae bacterium]
MNASMDPRLVKEMLMARWTAWPGEQKTADPFSGMLSLPAGAESASFAAELARLLSGSPKPAAGPLPVPLPVFEAWLNPEASAHHPSGSASDGSSYESMILEASARYGVDPALIRAVIRVESSFRHDAVSPAGAKGLMQLMDDTAKWLGVTDPFDPRQNIDGGTRFLSWLLRKYDGNLLPALAAYNAGPGLVDRLGLTTDGEVSARWSELPEETQAYIGKVLRYMRPF